MSDAVKGQLMTLSVEDDLLAESRSFSLHFTQGSIDVTSRDNNAWADFLVGRRDWSIDFDGLYIYDDVAQKVLRSHFTDQSPAALTCIITMPDGATFTGEAILESMDYVGPYDDALTFSGSLKGQGAITASVS
jgi:predicted secreted protein